MVTVISCICMASVSLDREHCPYFRLVGGGGGGMCPASATYNVMPHYLPYHAYGTCGAIQGI